MQVLDFAVIAHRAGRRLRLSVPSRRGESAYFAALELRLAACREVVSARANPLTGSIVILHTPAFDLSSAGLSRFGLVCAGPTPAERGGHGLGGRDAKLMVTALEIIAAALTRQRAGWLARLALEASVGALLQRLVARCAQPASVR
jgi:hypothetical protein